MGFVEPLEAPVETTLQISGFSRILMDFACSGPGEVPGLRWNQPLTYPLRPTLLIEQMHRNLNMNIMRSTMVSATTACMNRVHGTGQTTKVDINLFPVGPPAGNIFWSHQATVNKN